DWCGTSKRSDVTKCGRHVALIFEFKLFKFHRHFEQATLGFNSVRDDFISKMSVEVHQFLNDSVGGNFTESAPRPPVPGEENELTSNGGHSTRSSGSHKSHASNKSHSSIKSIGSHRSDVSHSPAATPRRSNLDGKNKALALQSQGLSQEDMIAPLGFEPEGSATNSPPFTENSTPPYLKWAESLKFLLEDSDGLQLYKEFLSLEQCYCPVTLDFWFACKGLRQSLLKFTKSQSNDAKERAKIFNLAKVIYRKYIRGDQLSSIISKSIRQTISERVTKKDIELTLFDEAQDSVEKYMTDNTWPIFLKSDIYVQYIQAGGESPKTGSNGSSGSSSARPLSQVGPLPTLHENEELQTDDIDSSQPIHQPMTPVAVAPLTSKSLMATTASRAEASFFKRPEATAGLYLQQCQERSATSSSKNSYPYHVSYTTVSAQDSELQSLSSDAMTDDTMSLTDSSVDGVPIHGRYSIRKSKRIQRSMHRDAAKNKDTSLNMLLVKPRTERAPKDRNIAETDPAKFASDLIDRLLSVKDKREADERMESMLGRVSASEGEESCMDARSISMASSVSKSALAPPAADVPNATLAFQKLMETVGGADESAQSILEDHCSRVWESSAGQTPSRSPGRHSPKEKSPDRAARIQHSLPGTLHKPHKNKKDKEYLSTYSGDSGVGDDKSGLAHTPMYSSLDNYGHGHKHIHHVHHHHHHISKDFKSKHLTAMEIEAQRRAYPSLIYKGEAGKFSMEGLQDQVVKQQQGRGRPSKKTSTAKTKSSETSSNIDSGVSMVYDKPKHDLLPNPSDPNNTKVLAWMLDNEKVTGSTVAPQSDSEKSSSQKRSSHRSLSTNASPALHHRQNKPKSVAPPKQPLQYNASRPGSLERSVPAKPSQPFATDPSMPLIPPPNPTVQLEEAKRRLEETEAAKFTRLRQSKSFTNPINKRTPSPYGQPTQMLPPQMKVPSTTTEEDDIPQSAVTANKQNEKKLSKKTTHSAPSTPSQVDSTIVGYYFCADPIPYRTSVPGKIVTLAQFKALINKKGNYRYFFKCASNDFGSEVVHEEAIDDHAILPMWEGKIVGKVEKIE
ncbi:unnamed protein product, partial [Owenia fusiformis]